MYIGLFLTFLLAHIIGDFYFQSNELAEAKEKSYLKIVYHSIIYLLAYLIPLVIFSFKMEILLYILLVGFSHLCIDLLKKFLSQIFFEKFKEHNKIKAEILSFFIDQILHIGLLAFFFRLLIVNDLLLYYSEIFNLLFVNNNQNLRYVITILILGKPANIIFKKLFSRYKPLDKAEEQSQEKIGENCKANNLKAGALIGFLERVLIFFCIVYSQFLSIGLILTAKSITRYNKISNEPNFAEYYLIGTLSSIIITIITYSLVYNIIF